MSLHKEFQYFLSNREELLKKHNGKVVVISGEQVVGVYETDIQAVAESQKTMKLGTFLVQRVEPSDASFKQTFHTRVTFA